MKRRLSYILLTALMLLIAGCSSEAEVALSEDEIIALNEEETYPDGPYSLSVIFDSMEELYDYSDLIVECHVDSSEEVGVDGFAQTHSMVTIDTVFLGDVSEGDTLKVLEEGGKPDVEPGESTIRLDPGEHFVLFLVESKLPGYEEAYYISGAFQGKFIEREGYYFQQGTEGAKLSLEEYYPQTMSGMVGLLEELEEK